MSSFLFGFAAALLLTIGARDQLLVARLAGPLGAIILLAALVAAVFTAGLMALAGYAIAQMLPDAARRMLVAIALVVAAVELVWPGRDKRPKEPTRSPFAAFVVLLARQWGDAARRGTSLAHYLMGGSISNTSSSCLAKTRTLPPFVNLPNSNSSASA